jgi:hypothetical protein
MSNPVQQAANKFLAEKEINNKKFQIRKLGALKGIKIIQQLSKVLIPIFGGTLDGFKHDDFVHGAPKTFSSLALTIVESVDQIDVEGLILDFTKEMRVDGEAVVFDDFFSANYSELLSVLEFCLKENFPDFFPQDGTTPQWVNKIINLIPSDSSK